ncbi:glycosyltransferase [Chitinivorax sp. B]|uniref:MGDG synthase family glycosyltransferase n=1 Tax=Chitinivorax sp. B TaxID=2502235 RepID=UPI0014850DB9|nr:glycosyltransferase [Chitinivorax sp. B]
MASILLLHATAGAGHTRAAQAVAAALLANDQTDVQVTDILACTSSLFRKMYVKSYIDLVQHAPRLWGYLYEKHDKMRAADSKTARTRLLFDKANSRRFKDLLTETNPKVILCTHFLPLELLSDRKQRGKLTTPVHAVITDVSPHAFWVYPHIDHYHVANAASARELECKGIPPERISVTGIPVDPIFAQQTSAPQMRAQLGLPERPTVLLLSGGFGVGPLLDMLNSFEGEDCGLSLVVVAGRNAELEAACHERAQTLKTPVTVHGFVNNIHELMDAADLVVTKPGGLTTNEILAKGKPMALVAPIPGQEQRNCEHLLEEGAAVRLYDVADARWFFTQLFSNAEKLASMQHHARRVARPQAAMHIADHLLQQLVDG